MIFAGENEVRISKETVALTLIESFGRSLIGCEPYLVKVIYHRNGDLTLKFRNGREKTAKVIGHDAGPSTVRP